MDWRTIFYIGGVSPLVLVPLLALFLPEPAGFRAARAAVGAALRRPNRKKILRRLQGRRQLLGVHLLLGGLLLRGRCAKSLLRDCKELDFCFCAVISHNTIWKLGNL
jgi:hypothetical protein